MSPRRAVVLLLLAGLAAVSAGCGSVARTPEGEGSASGGRELFVAECGACHTLADAGTRSEVGPNLDHAFGVLRRAESEGGMGFDESTIRDVVRGQIAYPTENPAGVDEEGNPFPGMPPNLVTGQDAADVAAYVASVAGLEVEDGGDAAPPAAGGEALFAQNCGSCHVLSAAGTSGSIGPNLDQLAPDAERVLTAMRQGPGAMPSFTGQLTDEQMQEIATFVADDQ